MPSNFNHDTNDLQIFDGSVANYPDWRRRAQFYYAALDSKHKHQAGLKLMGRLRGAPAFALKYLQPDDLQNRQNKNLIHPTSSHTTPMLKILKITHNNTQQNS